MSERIVFNLGALRYQADRASGVLGDILAEMDVGVLLTGGNRPLSGHGKA